MLESLFTNPRAIFLVVFALLLAALMWKDRKNVRRVSILFYRRTKKGIDYIDRIAKKYPRFWNIYGWAGVVIGILTIIISALMIAHTIYELIFDVGMGGPSLVLPGVSGENQFQAGVSFIAAEYWIISIGILMFVHELSHGIVARAENFEINSVGWIVLGIIPGAFVEPKGEKMLPGDEVENIEAEEGLWNQGNWKSRLKVLCAGSFANYIVGIIFLLGAIGGAYAVTEQGSVAYTAQEGYPAYEAGMNNGTLYEINNQSIETEEDVEEQLTDLEIGQEVGFNTSEGEFTVIAGEHPDSGASENQGYLGIFFGQERIIQEQYEDYQTFLEWFLSLLETVGLLNIFIGLFNMVPAKPLDGGQVVDTLIREFNTEENIKYLNYWSLIAWAIILGAIVAALAL